MKRISLLISLMSILWSCEKELEDFKTKNSSKGIVVYGEVTNLPGPYLFRINQTTAYNAYDVTEFVGDPVIGAEVFITKNENEKIDLVEIDPGLYQSPNDFIGEIGANYQLNIQTKNGLTIQSTKETLLAPNKFSKAEYQFIEGAKIEDMHFDIDLKLKDQKSIKDFYFIKRQDFIEFLTTCPNPPPPPAPVPECKSKCWQAPPNSTISLLDDFLVDGQELKVETAPVNFNDFTNYIVQFELYHVDSKYFNFWKRLEDQRKIGGGLFDKIPAQILGNLICTNKPEQEVLGYFAVAGKTKKRILIDRFNGEPNKYFNKLVEYVNFNNIRYKDAPVWDCRQAGWVPYNIGYSIPE